MLLYWNSQICACKIYSEWPPFGYAFYDNFSFAKNASNFQLKDTQKANYSGVFLFKQKPVLGKIYSYSLVMSILVGKFAMKT